ncbi:signal peptidase II [Paenibacillus filicis]|uniref:Lipoprotein signal peptidase n=1 Tax=Paenibacillus gyeongsangnamensis TaxID=3388067 RepID=A0ABT4Q2E3_9BACL|nr:signal peptidase II [Paenibacillus filicis]MCZ8511046.1 signal peptidase II [Paenibacillus filicis]
MLFYITCLLSVLADQATKLWIRGHLAVGDSIEVWPGMLRFTRYENSGAAFSSFQGYGRWFVLVAVALSAAVLIFRKRGEFRTPVLELGTGLFVGGAAGNAIDRIVFGSVTDFIQFESSRGIMNLADQAIHIGVLLILLNSLIAGRSRGSAEAAGNHFVQRDEKKL